MKAEALKARAKEFGADLIGIASIDKFKDLAPERNPLSIFPECKSVIVLGRRILRGALRGIEEGTNFGSPNTFGYKWLEDNFISQTTYDVTCWIEEQQYEAVPLFGYNQEGMPDGTPVSPDKPAPNVIIDYEFAAYAAGLAEMGQGGFLLSNEFGPRQRFATILTDAELETDAPKKQKLCIDCNACVDACPLGAFKETTSSFGLDSEMRVAEIDYDICKSCPNGASTRPGVGNETRPVTSCLRQSLC